MTIYLARLAPRLAPLAPKRKMNEVRIVPEKLRTLLRQNPKMKRKELASEYGNASQPYSFARPEKSDL